MVDWDRYLNKEIKCDCGRTYECDIKHITVKKGALEVLPSYINEGNYKKVCLICDQITNEIACQKVETILTAAGISFEKVLIEQDFPIADEKTLGSILVAIPQGVDLLLAVGSGTINDMCRFISCQLKIKYFIIGTAPSMDGYASDVSPLFIRGVKITYEKLGRPEAIIGDIDILKNAPLHMIDSGVGDVLGKYIALTEWKVANIVTGEYYCPAIVDIMNKAVEAAARAADGGLADRDEAAIGAVMDGLIFAGIGMCYAGNSRPASGSEHHMSHYWEMKLLEVGHHEVLHGTKVGINTLVAALLYKKLAEYLDNGEEFKACSFDKEAWSEGVKQAFGAAASVVLGLEEKCHKNSNEAIQKRVAALNAKRAEIRAVIKGIPDFELMLNRMKHIKAAYKPEQIYVDDTMVRNAILYAKEIRNRYAILQLLFDIGKLEEAADYICQEIKKW